MEDLSTAGLISRLISKQAKAYVYILERLGMMCLLNQIQSLTSPQKAAARQITAANTETLFVPVQSRNYMRWSDTNPN
mgnify:CR=1 FL=1